MRRFVGFFLSPTVILALLSPATVLGLWQIFDQVIPRKEVTANVVNLEIDHWDSMINVHLAFINTGNRHAAITSLQVVHTVGVGPYLGYGTVRTKDSNETVAGVPIVLNPGDIKLIVYSAKLPLEGMYSNATPVDPSKDKIDSPDLMKLPLRKTDLKLFIRALDHRGNMYSGYMQLAHAFLIQTAIPLYQMENQYSVNVLKPEWRQSMFLPYPEVKLPPIGTATPTVTPK